ncbi:hypothetical protein Tco_0397879 [Tanacetum coccineum]
MFKRRTLLRTEETSDGHREEREGGGGKGGGEVAREYLLQLVEKKVRCEVRRMGFGDFIGNKIWELVAREDTSIGGRLHLVYAKGNRPCWSIGGCSDQRMHGEFPNLLFISDMNPAIAK